MNNSSVGHKVILIAFIIFILYLSYIAYGLFSKKEENKIQVVTHNSDIIFSLKKEGIIVHGYEVRSLLDKKENSFEYKKILEQSIERKVSKIVIRNYKNLGIEERKPYYITISREGILNEPGVVMQSINFCIKDNSIVYSTKNDEDFITNCLR
ncbi:hypothetical protein ACEN3H_01460 [Acinetobacter lactucae]|uniref:hypothetical protein n=1 Tax=Acinetobacter lactucae TaxID=1785128 RepID=UPI00358DB7ED